jgi:aldose 1-epimerase
MNLRAMLLLSMSAVCVLACAGADAAAKRGVTKKMFGKLKDGQSVTLYTLTNKTGAVAKIMTYGAIVTELHVPDKNGKMGDVVLGFGNLAAYEKGHPFFGAIAGRVANRIAKGRFKIDGKTYKTAINNGPNTLHGGIKGFDKKVWKAEEVQSAAGPAVRFTVHSPDMDEGFPGNLDASVTYTLTDDNALRIDYTARTDKATYVNLTNHSYFNLAGDGEVRDHVVQFNADKYTPVDDTMIPTGEIKAVAGTPFDFRKPTAIGARIDDIPGNPGGYDHNMVVNRKNGGRALTHFATIYEPTTGRVMDVSTTEPGVQFYTGNFLDGSLTGKNGVVYNKNTGFCLEAQDYPDAINHPNFPSPILRPGQTYTQTTIYKFSVRK